MMNFVQYLHQHTMIVGALIGEMYANVTSLNKI